MKPSITREIYPEEFEKYGIEKEYTVQSLFDLEDTKEFDDDNIKGPIKPGKLEMRSVNPRAKPTGRTIKGFAGTTEQDRAKDIIPIETFIDARKDLLQPGSSTMFLNHDTSIPIGIVSSTSIDKNKGLFFEGFISKAADVNDIWTKAEEGILNSFSIRLRPKKVEVREDGEGRVEAYVIKGMDLVEVSLVGIPMNKSSSVTEVISKSFDNAKSKYNEHIKEDINIMNDNVDSKMTTAADLINKSVADALDAKLEGLIGKMGTALDEKIVAAFVAHDKTKAEAVAKAEADEAERLKAEKEVADKLKADELAKNTQDSNNVAIINALATLTDAVKSMKEGGNTSEPGKKGVAGDLDNKDDNKPGEIKKTLKSATDTDTMRYILKLGESDSEYKKLSDEEKEQARCMMFAGHVALNSK